MTMTLRLAAALLAALPLLATADVSLDLAPTLRLRSATALADGAQQSTVAEAIIAADARLGELRGHVLALTAFDAQDRLEPGRPDTANRSAINPRGLLGDRGEAVLREVYVDAAVGATRLRIGKQPVVWGVADGIKYLDVVNPQNFREFIAAPQDESRTPLWSLLAQRAFGDALELELIAIPDLTFHDLPSDDALFAITSPLLTPGGAAATPPNLNTLALALDRVLTAPGGGLETIGDPLVAALLPLLGLLDGIARPLTPQAIRDALTPALRFREQRPALALDTMEFGGRAKVRLGSVEAALVAFRHHADVPRVSAEVTAEAATVTLDRLRTTTLGLQASRPLGPLLLRLEAVTSTRAPLPSVRFAGTDQRGHAPLVGALLGGDLLLGDHFLSLQLGQQRLLRQRPSEPVPPPQTYVSALWRIAWPGTRLSSELFAISNLRDGDLYLRPRLAWQASDAWAFGVGVDAFSGPRSSVFGQFGGRDRLLLDLVWTPG